MMRMPFGKHKGELVHSLPADYINWLWCNCSLREPLKTYVGRAYFSALRSEPMAPVVEPDASRVQNVYRRLALKWHPDRGGSNDAMAAVNEFYEELKNDAF